MASHIINLTNEERPQKCLFNITNKFLLLTIIIASILRISVMFTNPHIIFSREDQYRGTVTKEIISGIPFHEYKTYRYNPDAWGHFLTELLIIPLYKLFNFSYIPTTIKSLLWFYLTAFVWFRFIRDFINKGAAQCFLIFFLLPPSLGFASSFRTGHFESLLPIGIVSYIFLTLFKKPSRIFFKGIICGFLMCYSADVCFVIPIFFIYMVLSHANLLQRKFLYFFGGLFCSFIPFIYIFLNANVFHIWEERWAHAFLQHRSNLMNHIFNKISLLLQTLLPKLFIYDRVIGNEIIAYLLYFLAIVSFLYIHISKKLKSKFPKAHIDDMQAEGVLFLFSYTIYFFFFSIFLGMYTLGKSDEYINYRHLTLFLIPIFFYLSHFFYKLIQFLHYHKNNFVWAFYVCLISSFNIFFIVQCWDKINLYNVKYIGKFRGYSYYFFASQASVNQESEVQEITRDPILKRLNRQEKLCYYLGKLFLTRPDKLFFLTPEYLEKAHTDDLKAFVCGVNSGWYIKGLHATRLQRRKNDSFEFYYQFLLPQNEFIKNIIRSFFEANNKSFASGLGWGIGFASFEFYENLDMREVMNKNFSEVALLEFLMSNEILLDVEGLKQDLETGRLLFLNTIGLAFNEEVTNQLKTIENNLIKKI